MRPKHQELSETKTSGNLEANKNHQAFANRHLLEFKNFLLEKFGEFQIMLSKENNKSYDG